MYHKHGNFRAAARIERAGGLSMPGPQPLWPVLLYAGLVVLLVAGMVVGSSLIGERHREPDRNLPYESGIVPFHSARVRLGVQYYLVGVFFILFDLEAVIVFAWAVAFRELRWAGFVSIGIFIVTLFLGLAYVWKEGGLDWNRPARPAPGDAGVHGQELAADRR
jgi:NADH-quinone oxidoreductase subunit A